ncbi:MAG: ThiF family adenylyltransferase [Planctomycetota bacterium]
MLRAVEKIVVIGCGGTGSWLLGPLLRFLNAEEFRGEVHLWDGDRYSPENQERQEFAAGSIGQNKAETQAGAFRANYPALRIVAHAEYVTAENVAQAVTERAVIITAVDNHPLRVLVDRQAGILNDVCVLSAGNEKLDGNVHVLLRRACRAMTNPLLQRHPEIAKAKHGNRAEMGCEALVAKGDTQLLITNFLAAAAALAAFHLLWTHGERSGRRRQTVVPQEVYFDAGLGLMSLVPAPT